MVSQEAQHAIREQQLKEIVGLFGLHTIYLFGSRASETSDYHETGIQAQTRSQSDLDVGIRLLPGKQLVVADKSRLAARLEELFAVARVDLVVLHEANPFLAANIVRGVRFYTADTYDADEYDLYVLRRAGDLAYFERQRQALILGQSA